MQPLDPTRYSKRHDDPGVGWFTVVVDADQVLFVAIHGKGTVPGTRALVAMFDEIATLREGDETLDVFMDLSGLSKTPLRAQAIMGKWLLVNRGLVGRVAIFGAKPWERKITQAILKVARFDRASLFKTRAEAASWLRPGRAP
jgi:hypothetical protein